MSALGELALSSPVEQVDALGLAVPVESCQSWPAVRALPLRVTVQIRVAGITVRDLQMLAIGHVLITSFSAAEDVPVRAGGSLLAWAEFDSLDGRMAVRITQHA